MDKFEKQFEDMDVQSQAMDQSMSNTVTLSIPEVQSLGGAPLLCLLLTFSLR